MGCEGGVTRVVAMVMWTDKTESYSFFPIGPAKPMRATKARGTLKVEQSTGAFKGKIMYRYSNDGISFDSAIDAYATPKVQTNNGTSYGQTFETLNASTKDLIQWGVAVANSSDTQEPEIAFVTVKIEEE